MSLLQGEVLQKTMAKNTLRQRIYSTALDYFCAEKTYPTQSGPAVTEDVQVCIPLANLIWFEFRFRVNLLNSD